jgi:N12 class adenine-specific DNA methylase
MSEIYTKISETEVKVTITSEVVKSIPSLKAELESAKLDKQKLIDAKANKKLDLDAMFDPKITEVQAKIDGIKAELDKAKAVGIITE